jgi:hypothetical protein
MVEEGLDTKSRPGRARGPSAMFPGDEREHPQEAVEAAGAPLSESREQHFGVCAAAVRVVPQLGPQLPVVVDLPDEGEAQVTVGTAHRLSAPR